MENNNQMVQAFNKAIADSGIKIYLHRDDMYCEWNADVDTSEHDKQIRAEVIDKLLCRCGGGNYESDCELCTFAIFRDDIRIGCEILELKEQK